MARARFEIDAELAKELFLYDAETGELRWRVWVNNRAPEGAIAGCVAQAKRARSPYRVVRVRGRMYFAHRIIFAIMTGEVPHEIDHINGDGLDNRWCNLRACSKGQNNANMRKRRGTRSAYKGVTFYKPGLKHWRARITIPGRPPWTIGYFHTEEEASAAYQAAAQEHFGEFARTA
jgi:hypothetical protein